MTIKETLKRIFDNDLTDIELMKFVEEYRDYLPELRDQVKMYIENQAAIWEMGIRDKIDGEKKPIVHLVQKGMQKEMANKMLATAREVNGQAKLRKLFRLINREMGLSETAGFDKMPENVNKVLYVSSKKLPVKKQSGEPTGSNRDQLTKAAKWMNPLVKTAKHMNFPSQDDITNLFKKEYPGFELEYPTTKRNFSKGGEIKKTPFSEALKFIFEKKYPNESITADAIVKRYNKLDYW